MQPLTAMTDLVADLPHLLVLFNALAACFCVVGYVYIRRKERYAHRVCMLAALFLSALFLIAYLIYHFSVGYTPFSGQGLVRPLFFALLISHIILAVLMVPMIAMVVALAWRGNFAAHRRLARWTLPIWFYVSVTGVLSYFLVFHLYST